MGRMIVKSENGALIDWSPAIIARMALAGVEVDGERLPQPRVWQTLISAARAWFQWTTALPGDLFHDYLRDLVIRVHSGTPKHRRVQVMSGMLTQYPVVRRMGVEPALATMPAEPSTWTWRDVYRVKAR